MRNAIALMAMMTFVGCTAGNSSPESEAEQAVSLGDSYLEQACEGSSIEDVTDGDYEKMTQVEKDFLHKAMSQYDKAIQLDPNFAQGYFRRGMANLAQDDNGQAIADFGDAIRLEPANARAHWFRSLAYEAEGEMDKAKQDREKALELDPTLD